eukprot:TRINITY_DN12444_c0_g1_i1.p2 TRINITY_DN12444_c0_g1~~TRINITY_DN12444_c0_g1_i1.p2  ORF type:complete len:120 (+),score=14.13 TRINITY_DN12444_c0_g1_i1:321-680(+)
MTGGGKKKIRNTNEPKGYGFVKFLYGISAYSAVSFLTGYQVYHKRLKVSYAHQSQAAHIIGLPSTTQLWGAQLPKLNEYYTNFQPQYAQFVHRFQQMGTSMPMPVHEMHAMVAPHMALH